MSKSDKTPQRILPPARVRTRTPDPAPAPTRTRPRIPATVVAAAPSHDPATPASPTHEYVGYRNPPKRTQFKPGQSGNPKGRPKGSVSMSTLIGEELTKPIKATIRGKTVTMSHRLAMIRRFIGMAMQGDHRAFAILIKLDPAARSEEPAAAAQAPLTAQEMAMLADFERRLNDDEPEDES